MEFIWDENKALINQAKHGVTFLEAATVFNDTDALFMGDPIIQEMKNDLFCLA